VEIRASQRIGRLGGYAFDEIDRLVGRLKSEGVKVLDFGVGDPSYPTPELIRQATREGLDRHAAAGYPSYVGSLDFRKAVAGWIKRRHGVELSPDNEVMATIGAKEAVFHFPEAIIDPGEVVLIPSPGYPPYRTGTAFAEGLAYYYPLTRENGYLPKFDEIPADVLKRARILWLNYPNSPTGRIPPDSFYREAVAFAARHNLILASDEAYSEIYFSRPPRSFLEFSRDGVIVFQSFSKRSAMTGYRVGWVCGDPRLVALVKKLKTNIDSGVPNFVQEGAIASILDERHVEDARAEYRLKKEILLDAFAAAGLDVPATDGTIYLWQHAPQGMSSVEYARELLRPSLACAVVPGALLATPVADGSNPGEAFVRWALCPGLDDVREAARRLSAAHF
jgi:LL-diaminopimelate aminotransferase